MGSLYAHAGGRPDKPDHVQRLAAYCAVGRVSAVMPGSADDVRRERDVPRWSWDGLVTDA